MLISLPIGRWFRGICQARRRDDSAERAQDITGVDANLIREAARMYTTTKPASIMTSAAPVVHHTNGVQNYRAVFCLIGLTGNFDIHGGNLMNKPSLVHIPGGFPTREGEFTLGVPSEGFAGKGRLPSFSGVGPIDHASAGVRYSEADSDRGPLPAQAAFCMGFNHRMFPDSQGFIDAFSKLDFIAVADPFLTDSAKYADIVLPACTSVERSEARCWPMGYVMLSQPAIEPVGQSRSDVDIIAQLSKELGLGDDLLESGFDACLDWMLEPSALSVAELKKHPSGMFVPDFKKPPKEVRRPGIQDPVGQVRIHLRRAFRNGRRGLRGASLVWEPDDKPRLAAGDC